VDDNILNLTNRDFLKIKNHAIEELPNECCGLLIDTSSGIDVSRSNNVSDNKLSNFSIDIKDYFRAIQKGKIIAFYHSHGESDINEFSLLDKINSINHKLPMILYNTKLNEFKLFNSNDLGCSYVGKPFKFEKATCLTLVENFYLKEFNIPFPPELKNTKWVNENLENMETEIKKCGFQIINGEKKFGDLILLDELSRGKPNHLMIYLNNNQILHHKHRGYSTVEIYNEQYKKHTHSIARHTSRN